MKAYREWPSKSYHIGHSNSPKETQIFALPREMDNARLNSASSAGEPAYTVAKSPDGYDIECQDYIVPPKLVGPNSLHNSDSFPGANFKQMELKWRMLPYGEKYMDEINLHVKALTDTNRASYGASVCWAIEFRNYEEYCRGLVWSAVQHCYGGTQDQQLGTRLPFDASFDTQERPQSAVRSGSHSESYLNRARAPLCALFTWKMPGLHDDRNRAHPDMRKLGQYLRQCTYPQAISLEVFRPYITTSVSVVLPRV